MKYVTPEEIKSLLEEKGIYNAIGNITMNLNSTSVIIKQNDIIGNALQEWLGQVLKENNIYFRPAIGQTFPDFYLSDYDDKNLCEMKTFLATASPAFDISNFLGYTNSLAEHPYRLDSKYIIFSYINDAKGNISIKEIWCKNVWEITGPATDYPLNCQRRNGQIVNIRPINWFSPRAKRAPFSCKEEFLAALFKTHLSYTNQTKISKEWLNRIISGYIHHAGEDMTKKLKNFM